MFRKLSSLTFLIVSLNAFASDIWVDNRWEDDFIRGLWQGCIVKTLNASDYLLLNKVPTGIEIRDSKHPTLVAIKEGCNCQTQYFKDNYSKAELMRVLPLGSTSKEYVNLISEVNTHCF